MSCDFIMLMQMAVSNDVETIFLPRVLLPNKTIDSVTKRRSYWSQSNLLKMWQKRLALKSNIFQVVLWLVHWDF